MNTTLTPTTRHDTTQSTTRVETQRPARRVGLIDRAALHLGMALIRWGRRPDRALARSERRASRLEQTLIDHDQRLALAQQRAREREQIIALAYLTRIR
ncbi:hypothetical protein [Homoserinibacter sp. GY 40078]|uniref:hypothetical protein n=1 Tax=Homoserinibacter sp. GY 40078 TaxID=2603275 RepID=UPI0011CB7E9E|nr:hypothetical protein [Homoserinibacter sp. GY 40078]TXK19576.1 hypothetical protein FVQ89_06800 [Homoserinibacter sp. GY 40078]